MSVSVLLSFAVGIETFAIRKTKDVAKENINEVKEVEKEIELSVDHKDGTEKDTETITELGDGLVRIKTEKGIRTALILDENMLERRKTFPQTDNEYKVALVREEESGLEIVDQFGVRHAKFYLPDEDIVVMLNKWEECVIVEAR